MVHTVKLISKGTKFAGRTLAQANFPAHWIVKDEKEEMSWSTRKGPWLFVTPDNNAPDQEHWVSLTDDNNFFVEVVR